MQSGRREANTAARVTSVPLSRARGAGRPGARCHFQPRAAAREGASGGGDGLIGTRRDVWPRSRAITPLIGEQAPYKADNETLPASGQHVDLQ